VSAAARRDGEAQGRSGDRIALWLIGARTLVGAVVYQTFFLGISAGLLIGTLQYADSGQQLLGIGLSLIMAPIGSTFLIVVLSRRRRERAGRTTGPS
jgi:hypothetical protein